MIIFFTFLMRKYQGLLSIVKGCLGRSCSWRREKKSISNLPCLLGSFHLPNGKKARDPKVQLFWVAGLLLSRMVRVQVHQSTSSSDSLMPLSCSTFSYSSATTEQIINLLPYYTAAILHIHHLTWPTGSGTQCSQMLPSCMFMRDLSLGHSVFSGQQKVFFTLCGENAVPEHCPYGRKLSSPQHPTFL